MGKKLLKDIAYDEVKKKVLNQDITNMTENGLVKELNMSRTPIREALYRLQHEGFLNIVSNQGIIVNNISVTRLHELIDMRIAIETYSLKQAIKNLTDEDYHELEEIIQLQKESCEDNDYQLFKARDAEFHKYLLNITGNYYFLKMFSEARELQFMARKRKISKIEMMKFIKEHEIIVFYLRNNEIEQSVITLKHHLNSGKNVE